MCVSSQHKDIALKAIRSLQVFAESRKIFVITAPQNFTFFQQKLDDRFPVCLLDEDNVIEDITLRRLQDYFVRSIGTPQRAGWYFQQFLKMSACRLPEVAEYYLIWDSDTILMQALDFFDEKGNVFINPKTEYHRPYFETIKKLLNIEKQADYSFISEHLMIKKTYMQELLDHLMAVPSGKKSWVETLLDAVPHHALGGAGFSEFETYGNFIAYKYPDHFRCRSLKSIRYGAWHFGTNPSKYDIFSLMLLGYVFASFETWQSEPKKRIALKKILSRIVYSVCDLSGGISKRYPKMIDAASQICSE
jgi:hypothetical protein